MRPQIDDKIRQEIIQTILEDLRIEDNNPTIQESEFTEKQWAKMIKDLIKDEQYIYWAVIHERI